jgi:hypothetical protein
MNKVSEQMTVDAISAWINGLDELEQRLKANAVAVERLVQAAEEIVRTDREALANLERSGIVDNDTSLTDELDAALAAFRESER